MTRHVCSLVGSALLALLGSGCRSHGRGDARPRDAMWWAAPSNDVGDSCADVDDLRVCWDSPPGARVTARPLPAFAAPTALGFRCVGRGAARACEPRDLAAGSFACDSAQCTQAHPRQPDDGEWACADYAGIAVCVGSERAAGVAEVNAVSEWVCGPRRTPDRLGARVCVDLSPDFPEGRGRGLRCRWVYEHGVQRVCVRDPDAHVVGDDCDPARPCVEGAACLSSGFRPGAGATYVRSRCVPPKPAPSCWLDSDCGGGPCRFGACVGGSQ
jgi:hypothetical protein